MHVESHGSGVPLLLIHGWGMHGGVWNSIVPQLAQRFHVHCVDLPGHGYSRIADCGLQIDGRSSPITCHRSLFSLDDIVDELCAQFSEPLAVCGWSLGGQVALRWAQLAPDQVQRLVLVSSTPCFAEREDWLSGMAQDVLQQFAAELERDCAATLRRFLALQVRGSAQERELLSMLRACLFSRGEPDQAALRGGLEILRDTDLRGGLHLIRQPVLVIAGKRDKLTPPEAAYYLAQTLPNASVVEIAGAAHAPFLSHPEFFVAQLINFMKGDPQITQIK